MTAAHRPRGAAAAVRSAVPPELVPDRRGAMACLGSVSRGGDWIVPRLFRAVAMMGNVELDLTAARLGHGTSLIEVVAAMGSVTITVPPDVRVECEGDPIMGSFEIRRDAPAAAGADAPLVRITGTAVMGSVTVRVVDPDAPGWVERLRARLTGGV